MRRLLSISEIIYTQHTKLISIQFIKIIFFKFYNNLLLHFVHKIIHKYQSKTSSKTFVSRFDCHRINAIIRDQLMYSNSRNIFTFHISRRSHTTRVLHEQSPIVMLNELCRWYLGRCLIDCRKMWHESKELKTIALISLLIEEFSTRLIFAFHRVFECGY